MGESSDLTVSVPAIDGCCFYTTPSTFTLAKDGSKTINIEYTAPKPAEEGSIRINATAVDVTFAKKQVPTASISISVDGLPKDKTTTLTLTNHSGDIKEVDIKSNSAISIDIPKDGSICLKVTENTTPSTNWPARVIVGYVRGYDAPLV